MTMESMDVCTHHEKTIVQRIPAGWRELFQLLRHPSEGLTRGQVWYDQVFSSQYSLAPLWSDLVKALTAAEPAPSKNGDLMFECRFAVLPVVTQRNFLTLLHQYVDTIPVPLMKMFLEKIFLVNYSDPWLRLLRVSLMKCCMRSQEDISFDGDKQDSSQLLRYSFSTAENRVAVRSLCKDIQNTSFSLPWQQNYNFFSSTHVPVDAEEDKVVLSPVLITSLARGTFSDIIEVEADTVDSTCKQQVPEDRSGIDRPDSPAVKRLKLEESQRFSDSIHNTSKDLSFSEVSSSLTADEWAMVGRLKAKWHSVTKVVAVPEERLNSKRHSAPNVLPGPMDRLKALKTPSVTKVVAVPEEVKLFLSCIPSQTKEICDELQLNTLDEAALTVFCDHLCSLGEYLSISNCVEFLMAAVLPKVKATTVTISRSLRTVLIKLSHHFPLALIRGVILPCMHKVDAADCQIQLFCRLTKEMFSGSSRFDLLQRLVDGSVPRSAGLLSLLQKLMDLKVAMYKAEIHSTVGIMMEFSGHCEGRPKDLKVGKLLLTFVTLYGKQMNRECINQLKVAASRNQTFLKKAIFAAIAKEEKCL